MAGSEGQGGDIKGIRHESVSAWLEANISGLKAPFTFSLIAGGHSNLTYKVDDAAGTSVVLRRPPTGAVLATAHDMAREHKIVSAVSKTDVPVPQALGLCEDESVNDAPFYVMNYSDSPVSRITNFTAYANRSEEDRSILCIEVPTDTDSEIWADPEKHYPEIIQTAADMGIDADSITSHQAFKVPGTYRATLRGYEDAMRSVEDQLASQYGERVVLPTPHLLTRASIMHDLTEIGVLS